MTIAVDVGQFCNFAQLRRRDSPTQNRSPNIEKPLLLLRMNANMIAMNVRRDLFGFSGIERETNLPFQFGEEDFRGPAMLQEKVFQARLVAALAQHFARFEDFRHPARDSDDLLLANERVEPDRQM